MSNHAGYKTTIRLKYYGLCDIPPHPIVFFIFFSIFTRVNTNIHPKSLRSEDVSVSRIVARGAFSKVMAGKLRRTSGKTITVAVKVQRIPASPIEQVKLPLTRCVPS